MYITEWVCRSLTGALGAENEWWLNTQSKQDLDFERQPGYVTATAIMTPIATQVASMGFTRLDLSKRDSGSHSSLLTIGYWWSLQEERLFSSGVYPQVSPPGSNGQFQIYRHKRALVKFNNSQTEQKDINVRKEVVGRHECMKRSCREEWVLTVVENGVCNIYYICIIILLLWKNLNNGCPMSTAQ